MKSDIQHTVIKMNLNGLPKDPYLRRIATQELTLDIETEIAMTVDERNRDRRDVSPERKLVHKIEHALTEKFGQDACRDYLRSLRLIQDSDLAKK